ncbi:MAG: D-alanine--D-alanine ligase [Puniceicoccales bacterium]|jgi:D-alanine-D-alanine ligase|nr:D-alanine--D-alanine ligase [Puniceicoccales bacterium]
MPEPTTTCTDRTYPFRLVVLSGGSSGEREVSRRSGAAVARALSAYFPTESLVLERDELPPGLEPERDIICPMIHGSFGEDGVLQALLEREGFAYAGSGIVASERCMHKLQTKEKLLGCSVCLPQCISFRHPEVPSYEELSGNLDQTSFVLKPEDKGSSLGVRRIFSEEDWRQFCREATEGLWLAEPLISGREITVGWLQDRALPCVEIRPREGFYDYAHKYTTGLSDTLCPAPLENTVAQRLLADAEKACTYCGCRDFARVDFILSEQDIPYFLEINTIPGMTETSLLPQSAHGAGLDFVPLCYEMVYPAIRRFGFRELPPHAMA